MKPDRIQGILPKQSKKPLKIHDIQPRSNTGVVKLVARLTVQEKTMTQNQNATNNQAKNYKPTNSSVDELMRRLKIEY